VEKMVGGWGGELLKILVFSGKAWNKMEVNPTFLPPISSYLEVRRPLPPICDWALDDRPREKLFNKGCWALSDAELLALLIHSGTRDQSAVALAQSILRCCSNDISELGRLEAHQLREFEGIGAAKAASILAAMELGRRRQTAALYSSRTILRSSADAAVLLKPLLEDQPFETFYAIYLNHANKLLGHSRLSTGGRTSTTVDPRLLFESALLHKATRVLLCHNHPSGNLRPSQSDVSMTHRLQEAGKVLEIEVIDHVIVAETGYFSLREDGMM
jgi:DNA repair protein RadC